MIPGGATYSAIYLAVLVRKASVMDDAITVFLDLHGEPVRVGRLWVHFARGRQSADFEYDAHWLKNPTAFAIEPALHLGHGKQHTAKALFGAIGDSAPDRWGRILMQRAWRQGGKNVSSMSELDYLMMVQDDLRQGALRFKRTPGGPFEAQATDPIPPLVQLPKLLAAAARVVANKEFGDDIRLLLNPGSSLGGARPKASVISPDKHLYIAKFPQRGDISNVVRWEAVALELARLSGLRTAESRLVEYDQKAVLLVKRFDREDGNRIPFLSAMSMLEASDHEDHSYLEIAEKIRVHGSAPDEDLLELWKRMVFAVLISNTDDHLRNHGFLFENGGWKLSPVYDVNPVGNAPRIHSLALDLDNREASLDTVFSVAEDYMGISLSVAKQAAQTIGQVVVKWRSVATCFGIPPREQEDMSEAFEHSDLNKSLSCD